ncbi:MAG: 4Fe-4S dicluster domain-containing protein [Bacteroidales bacterium]
MNTNEYKDFLADCKKIVSKNKVFYFKDDVKDSMISEVFKNRGYIKQIAANIRNKFINAIDDNLIAFDKNFSANGGVIHWCIDYNDFLSKLDKVLLKNKIKNINLFSSYFTKELGINRFVNNKEYILDNESKDCVIFTPQFGIVNTGSLFLNFSSSYDMELVLNSKIKVFILSICDFLFKPEEVEIFSHLYSIYKNEVNFPYLTSLYTPSPTRENADVYLFLVDNGRTNVLENSNIRSSLTCINCDACKEVCPVFKLIGDEPYNNVFSGPIANVILPFIENTENYKHLCFSCTSCGNCSSVCPVKIPISEMIVSNKNYFFENKLMDMKDERLAKATKKFVFSRKNMNSKKWIKNIRLRYLTNSKVIEEYKFEKSTFNKQYIDSEHEK